MTLQCAKINEGLEAAFASLFPISSEDERSRVQRKLDQFTHDFPRLQRSNFSASGTGAEPLLSSLVGDENSDLRFKKEKSCISACPVRDAKCGSCIGISVSNLETEIRKFMEGQNACYFELRHEMLKTLAPEKKQ